MKKRIFKKIFIASDHGGFRLKKELVTYFRNIVDLGPYEFIANDDYPDYAALLAKKVAHSKGSFGILLCRNGQGVCIAANKIKNIRAVTGFSKKMVASTRKDDDANVLCLPADYLTEKEAKDIVKIFIGTKFSGAARHVRRLGKIKKLESGKF